MAYTNDLKPISKAYLLKEDEFFLLLENGDKIVLNQSSGSYIYDEKPS